MQQSIRHFVRKILGIHLLLLLLLLAVVSGAARHVYLSAQKEVMTQAKLRQELVASQTAHGIGGFYNSILGDLNLLKPESTDDSDLPDLTTQAPVPKQFPALGVIRQAAGGMLARQLQGRAHLFLVDERLKPIQLGPPEKPDRPVKPGKNPAKPKFSVITPAVAPVFEEEVVKVFGDWLKSVNEAAISPMLPVEHNTGKLYVKLVCVPLFMSQRVMNKSNGFEMASRRSGWLVAVVSARHIEEDFLDDVYKYDAAGVGANGGHAAFLVDDSMMIMAGSPRDLVATQLDNRGTDPELTRVLAEFKRTAANATAPVTQKFQIGGQSFPPSIVSVSPVKEVLGKQWFVVVVSPLQDVDKVVRELSSKALFWAIFVAVSMTAILVSTAAQLILSRMRMERLRHQSLQNEMRQARQIQLAWLPQKTKTTCSSSLLDIASLNRPATHVSGDFYNFFELPDGRTAVIIGDVTGHGMAAAFLMATTQLLIRNTLPQYCDPGRCLEDVNHQLTNQVFNGQFVTMQILVIDSRTGEVAIATAGHPAPLIGDGESFQPLKLEPQLVAGVDARTQYPTERFRLRANGSILLYTDGVVETEDPTGKQLRAEGLRAALKGPIETAETLLQRAVSAVNTFRRGNELRDDLTMVAVHLLPQPRVLPHAPSPTGSAKPQAAAQVT